MNAEITTDREAELRRMLVTTVSASALSRVRPTRKIIGAGMAAFVLAGALTGGAVASASAASSSQSDVIASLASLAKSTSREQNLELLGTPVTAITNQSTTLELGDRPAGATSVMVSFECFDSMKMVSKVDGRTDQTDDCTQRSQRNVVSAGMTYAFPRAAHSYSVSVSQPGRYAIWVSWVKGNRTSPSLTQQAALADGTITRAEYLAAFNRYQGCLDAAGYDIGSVPESAPILQFGLPGDAVESGADARCGAREFSQVDNLWQNQHPAQN